MAGSLQPCIENKHQQNKIAGAVKKVNLFFKFRFDISCANIPMQLTIYSDCNNGTKAHKRLVGENILIKLVQKIEWVLFVARHFQNLLAFGLLYKARNLFIQRIAYNQPVGKFRTADK